MNTFAWLIRRELWENRGIYMAPLIIAGIEILAALVGHSEFPIEHMRFDGGGHFDGIVHFVTGGLFGVVMIAYIFFYLADALYADRKDRSILFWKSLPITDRTLVLSKVATALLVIPAVYFVIGDLSGILASLIVSFRHPEVATSPLVWLQFQVLWIYLLIAFALWYVPVAGWLLLVSAWARRAVLFWVVFPPLVLGIVESLFFGTHQLMRLYGDRLNGFLLHGFNGRTVGRHALPLVVGDGSVASQPTVLDAIDLPGLLSSPGLWGGLVVGALLIYGAIEMRRQRLD
jgi:ABC-2 type transport system permease protein